MPLLDSGSKTQLAAPGDSWSWESQPLGPFSFLWAAYRFESWRGALFLGRKRKVPQRTGWSVWGEEVCQRRSQCQGLEGEPLRASQRARLLPSTPHKHTVDTLTQAFIQESGCFPSLVPACPPRPPIEPHSGGACPSSAQAHSSQAGGHKSPLNPHPAPGLRWEGPEGSPWGMQLSEAT